MDADDLLFLAFMEEEQRLQQARSWVHEPLLRRQEEGEYQHMALEKNNPDYFYGAYRMSPKRFEELMTIVRPHLHKQDTNFRKAFCDCEDERMAITLRYLASGLSMKEVARYFRVRRTTVSELIPDVCSVIWDVVGPLEFPPLTEDNWRADAAEFERRWNFPRCVGAMDGKHVTIHKPRLSGSTYHNYKGTCSTILAVVDADYKFTYIDVGAYGREHDSGVFARTALNAHLENGTLRLPPSEDGFSYCLVADEAFPLRECLMRPYPGERGPGGGHLPEQVQTFNYRLSRARRVSENAFGILVSKWRIFRQPIVASTETVDKVVKAACVLHNFLRRRDGVSNDREYVGVDELDAEDGHGVMRQGAWRQHTGAGFQELGRAGTNTHSRRAAAMRDRLAAYFVSPAGAVPWQQGIVRRGSL